MKVVEMKKMIDLTDNFKNGCIISYNSEGTTYIKPYQSQCDMFSFSVKLETVERLCVYGENYNILQIIGVEPNGVQHKRVLINVPTIFMGVELVEMM